jgi:hypothetical protein
MLGAAARSQQMLLHTTSNALQIAAAVAAWQSKQAAAVHSVQPKVSLDRQLTDDAAPCLKPKLSSPSGNPPKYLPIAS